MEVELEGFLNELVSVSGHRVQQPVPTVDLIPGQIQPGGLLVVRDDKVDHAAGSRAVLERQEVPHLTGIDASSGRSQVHPHQDAVSLRMVHTSDETAEGKPQILSCSSAGNKLQRIRWELDEGLGLRNVLIAQGDKAVVGRDE